MITFLGVWILTILKFTNPLFFIKISRDRQY